MATYLWTKLTGGDWNIAEDWTPTSGPPGLVAADADVANLESLNGGLSSFTVTVGAGTIESFSPDTLNISAEDLGHEVGLTIASGGILTTGTLALSDPLANDIHININNGGIFNIVTTMASESGESIDIESTGLTTGGRLEFGSATGSGIDVNASNVTFNFLDNPLGERSDGVIEYRSGFVPGLTTTQQHISGVSWGDGFIFDGGDFTGDTVTLRLSTLTVETKLGATVLTMENISADGGTTFVASGDEIVAVCYARGTLVRTPDGELPVEKLRRGRQVITLVDGEEVLQTVTWLGHRRIDLTAHPRPETVAPIRIRRDAFADNVPRRDLLVSPDHALFVDGMLICARQLANGTTIRPEAGWTAVDYYHVELDHHAILLAEGLPAESYLDTGNRGFFANGDAPLMLHPDLTTTRDHPTRAAGSCAPFVFDDAAIQPVWRRLAERAEALGHVWIAPVTTDDPGLRLLAGGQSIAPVTSGGGRYVFALPAALSEPGSVRLISRSGAPSDLVPYPADRRRLGVAVQRIVVRSSAGQSEIPADHPGLSRGWHEAERDGGALWRWTNGDAVLPLSGLTGPAVLEIRLAGSMRYVVDVAPMERTGQLAA